MFHDLGLGNDSKNTGSKSKYRQVGLHYSIKLCPAKETTTKEDI
jgi:hypothetical protein